MNNIEFITKLASDLSIEKISCENEVQFFSRITYSALGMWLRTILCKYFNSADSDALGNSKVSTHRRLSLLLNYYISLDLEINDWFYPDEKFDPIKVIRDTLTKSGDIYEFNFESQLTVLTETRINVSNNIAICQGLIPMPSEGFSSGLAWLTKNEGTPSIKHLNSKFNIPEENALSRFENYVSNAKWEIDSSTDNYEIFDADIRGVFSSCWSQSLHQKTNRVYMKRKQLGFGNYEYFLSKKTNSQLFYSRFSEYSSKENVRETQRFLYALKALGKQNTVVKYTNHTNYTVWRFYSKLPPPENSLLNYIGWPVGNATNPYNSFIVHNSLSGVVSFISNNLGLSQEEV